MSIDSRRALKRTIIDKRCVVPDGFAAGVDPALDRVRLHVTDRGICLVTPQMLDASIR